VLDHAAHVARRGRSCRLHARTHQLVELRIRQLGGQVGLDRGRLECLTLRELVAARLAIGRLGLAAALALAPEYRELVRVTLLRRLLQLGAP
jgi:hypothetical protein